MARNRYSRESAPQRASKYNLWIRIDKRTWFTVEEFRFKFGEDPQNLDETKVELLNPMPVMAAGREIVRKMIADMKTPESEALLMAFDKLNVFTDKIMNSSYKPLPYQENTIPWPDRVYPDIPKLPEPDDPDYNDLMHERTLLAEETAKQKALDAEEDLKRRRDKFTSRYLNK